VQERILAAELDDTNGLVTIWESDVSAVNELIKAGNCLYAADSTGITAIKITDNAPHVLWTHKSGKPVERLVASHGKLIAVTEDGEIMVFGDSPVSSISPKFMS